MTLKSKNTTKTQVNIIISCNFMPEAPDIITKNDIFKTNSKVNCCQLPNNFVVPTSPCAKHENQSAKFTNVRVSKDVLLNFESEEKARLSKGLAPVGGSGIQSVGEPSNRATGSVFPLPADQKRVLPGHDCSFGCRKLAEKDFELAQTKEELAHTKEELCGCQQTIKGLEQLSEQQARTLEHYKAKLDKPKANSRNSGMRPSSDMTNSNGKDQADGDTEEQPEGRSQGGQKGHPRHTRPPLSDEEATTINEYGIEDGRCPVCGGMEIIIQEFTS